MAPLADFSDEVATFLDRECPVSRLAGLTGPPRGIDLWEKITALGWMSVELPEEEGGLGLIAADQLGLAYSLARVLAPGVFLPTIALSIPAYRGSPAHRQISDGELVVAAGMSGEAPCIACGSELDVRLTGSVGSVLGLAEGADRVVALARRESGEFLLVEFKHDHPGVVTTCRPSLDLTRGIHDLALTGVPGRVLRRGDVALDVSSEGLDRLRLALAFENLAVAETVLRMAARQASLRRTFGNPIGSYQAVAHPLADTAVDIAVARAAIDFAGRIWNQGERRRHFAALLAAASASGVARRACERAIQVHGAMGYTWESPLHFYYRRALANENLLTETGDTWSLMAATPEAQARVNLRSLVDDVQAADARAEAARWLRIAVQPAVHHETAEELETAIDAWSLEVASSGILSRFWPAEHGGDGTPLLVFAAAVDEIARVRPRRFSHRVGTEIIAPCLLRYGTAEQQKEFLPRIADGSERWCQAFSEPDAGSDLASLKTRASSVDGGYALSGTKIWTTGANMAAYAVVLARTEPGSVRHRGLSCLLVDLSSPGVEVSPLTTMLGEQEFAEVVFDEVFVPSARVLGAPGDGWRVALTSLEFERTVTIIEDSVELEFHLDELAAMIAAATEAGIDCSAESRVATELWVQVQGLKLMLSEGLATYDRTGRLSASAGPCKLLWSVLGQNIARAGWALAHRYGEARRVRYWDRQLLESASYSIYAGSTEIMRSLIAEDIVQLPRSR